jgi:hypothetical protein
VVCKPKSRLTAGYEYELKLGTMDILKWGQNESKTLPPKWTAIDQIDLQAPAWETQPQYLSKSYRGYGCGPEVYVRFSFSGKDSSAILVKAIVTNSKTGATTSYYPIPAEGDVLVGHGMCCGAFAFKDHVKYTVKFFLMDASGNHSGGSAKVIPFTPPSS